MKLRLLQQRNPVAQGRSSAVIVECLASNLKLDTDIVQTVLGFVFDSLNPEITGDQNYKVGRFINKDDFCIILLNPTSMELLTSLQP
ncbi:unnamed protein product [Urochloa humidicola]